MNDGSRLEEVEQVVDAGARAAPGTSGTARTTPGPSGCGGRSRPRAPAQDTGAAGARPAGVRNTSGSCRSSFTLSRQTRNCASLRFSEPRAASGNGAWTSGDRSSLPGGPSETDRDAGSAIVATIAAALVLVPERRRVRGRPVDRHQPDRGHQPHRPGAQQPLDHHRRGARDLHAGRLRAGRDRLLPGEARGPRGEHELRGLRARVRGVLPDRVPDHVQRLQLRRRFGLDELAQH